MGRHKKEDVAIYEKCQHPDCQNIVRKLPAQIKRGNGKFCSQKCHHGVDVITPSEEKILWILENQNMPRKEMAKQLGYSPRHLTTVLERLRALNYNIRKFKVKSPNKVKKTATQLVPDDKMLIIKKHLYELPASQIGVMVNIDLGRINNICAKLRAKDKEAKAAAERKDIDRAIAAKSKGPGSSIHNNRKPATSPKKQEVRFKTRQIDESKCTRITIGKTTINVKPGEDVEAARKRWEEILRIGKKKAG